MNVFNVFNFNVNHWILFCNLKVSETDPLPKYVCTDCFETIDNFHIFHEKVHLAQTNYLKQLIKCERENHFIEIPTVHLNVDATLASEQIDSLQETNGLAHEPVIKLEHAPLSPPLISIDVPDQMNDDDNIGESDDDDDDEEDEEEDCDVLDSDNFEIDKDSYEIESGR